MCDCRARVTARLDGAPTAAMTGIPAITDFCTSSKLALPLTSRISCDNGRRPASNSAPISLSSALCRPTSSNRRRSRPSVSNKAAACNPPVRRMPFAPIAALQPGREWSQPIYSASQGAGRSAARQRPRRSNACHRRHRPKRRTGAALKPRRFKHDVWCERQLGDVRFREFNVDDIFPCSHQSLR